MFCNEGIIRGHPNIFIYYQHSPLHWHWLNIHITLINLTLNILVCLYDVRCLFVWRGVCCLGYTNLGWKLRLDRFLFVEPRSKQGLVVNDHGPLALWPFYGLHVPLALNSGVPEEWMLQLLEGTQETPGPLVLLFKYMKTRPLNTKYEGVCKQKILMTSDASCLEVFVACFFNLFERNLCVCLCECVCVRERARRTLELDRLQSVSSSRPLHSSRPPHTALLLRVA